jgi:mono/diheme cytochrome c family protein
MSRRFSTALLLGLLAASAGCRKPQAAPPDMAAKAYDAEVDWNDPQRVIPLNYREAQGKRIFYTQCVWCHADATPAGPSNRSNVTPAPPLMNDGAALNKENDATLKNVIALGGSALGKSAMMPPYGRTLSDEEIADLIACIRAIAQPPYQPPARSLSSPVGK